MIYSIRSTNQLQQSIDYEEYVMVVHQIKSISSSYKVHPNDWDEIICSDALIFQSDMFAYAIRSNGSIERIELDYFTRAI